MSSPKHLWSGDWERESDEAAPPPVAPRRTPEPPSEPDPPERGSALSPRVIGMTALVVLVLAGAVFATIRLTSGNGKKPHTTTTSASPLPPTTSPSPTPSPFPTTPNLPGISTSPTPAPTTPAPTTPTSTTSGNQGDSLGLVLESVPGVRSSQVIVQAVVPGSAADSVGISAGDELITLNGQKVSSPGQVESILAKLPRGAQVTMQLIQGSEELTATIQDSNGP